MKPLPPHEGMKRGIYLLPSLFTTGNLFCAFFSVIKTLAGDYIVAAWIILLAGIFDALDGRIARLTRTESKFGIEYDSLVDLCTFGFAPALLIYRWGMQDLGKLGLFAAFLYFACGALRLARFNVQHDTVENNYFQGLPIPIGAYVLSTYVIFYHEWKLFPPQASHLVAGMCIALSFLMVSTIGYRSMKSYHFKDRQSFFVLLMVVMLLFVIATVPEISLFVVSVAYVASGLLEEMLTRRKSKAFVEKVKEHRRKKHENKFEKNHNSEQPPFLQ